MQRKPSSDLTRRQYATITIDPFKSHKTKITAYAEFYNNYANDENTLLPEDLVTPWLAAGKPVMNPITGMITDLATGQNAGALCQFDDQPVVGHESADGPGGDDNHHVAPVPGRDYLIIRTTSPMRRHPAASSSGLSSRSKPSDQTTAA